MHSYNTQDLCTDTFKNELSDSQNNGSSCAGSAMHHHYWQVRSRQATNVTTELPGFCHLKLGDKRKGKPPAAKKKMSCSKSQCLVYYIFTYIYLLNYPDLGQWTLHWVFGYISAENARGSAAGCSTKAWFGIGDGGFGLCGVQRSHNSVRPCDTVDGSEIRRESHLGCRKTCK